MTSKSSFLQKISVLGVFLLLSIVLSAQLPIPREHFGFEPGTDRMLFNYEQLIAYFQKLEKASPKVKMQEIGLSEMGRPLYVVFISDEENILKLDRLHEINRKLALDELEGEKLEDLIEEGRSFVLLALSMHSTEVGPSQAAPFMAWELLNRNDEKTRLTLKNTVCMLVPSHNPDGMNMIVEHYNRYKGTAEETSNMPGVYHKYVGHNINRDFVTLHQSENKAIARIYSTAWFPQVMVEKHQMGSSGPRYFVSPPHDPIAENVDHEVWNWMRVFGSRALTEMSQAGLPSVSVNYLFDDYWPGATTTSIWKGVIGMLSEAASVHLATPIYVEPNELQPGGKGLSEYAISINMPKPWTGGWWRLGDIVRYEVENTLSYLHTAAIHRSEILKARNDISRREVLRGKQQAPFYYIFPQAQAEKGELVALVNLLHEHGVKAYRLEQDREIQNRWFRAGDVVVPLAQPYRAFIKEVLEHQTFPARYYSPEGELIRPYDITSWSLPLHRGVEAVEIIQADLELALSPLKYPYDLRAPMDNSVRWLVFDVRRNESFKAAFMALGRKIPVDRLAEPLRAGGDVYPVGSFLIPAGDAIISILESLGASPGYLTEKPQVSVKSLKMPRVALLETWFHDMDGGWTRFLLDQYGMPYAVIRPQDLANARLSRDYDLLIFSDQPKSVWMSGRYEREGKPVPSRYPAAFAKGMGKKGFENLINYIEAGGKVMAWGQTVELFLGPLSLGEGEQVRDFVLPASNMGPELAKKGVYVPGSLLKVQLLEDHPLTLGMPREMGVFHRGNPVFATSIPFGDMDRRVIGRFGAEPILMSGYAKNQELLARQPALIWLQLGKGQIILSSFNPQFRASTQASFKLLFNTLLLE